MGTRLVTVPATRTRPTISVCVVPMPERWGLIEGALATYPPDDPATPTPYRTRTEARDAARWRREEGKPALVVDLRALLPGVPYVHVEPSRPWYRPAS